jgi:tRNA-dihydrouridine synthase
VNAVEACRLFADHGCAAVCIHGRTRAQGYSGRADWTVIADAVRTSPIPVIGNGDIHTPAEARARMRQTGCAAVMIGRGAMGNPWIFAELSGLRTSPPTPEERLVMVRRHLTEQVAFIGRELAAIRRFRPHLVWYSRGLRGAAEFRRNAFRIEGLPELMELCGAFFLGAAVDRATEEPEFDDATALG